MKHHNNSPRVLMIGIDAAASELIEQWMDEGVLPNLKCLRNRGAYGRLASTADWLVSSVWPCFSMGTTPNKNGCYHYLQWRADEMGIRRLQPEWMLQKPFWRTLSQMGPRVVALDIPYQYAPEPFNGIEISGWATHDLVFPTYVFPDSLEDWIHRNFGPSAHRLGASMAAEMYAPRPLDELLNLREQLIETTNQAARLSMALMEQEPWNLFITVLGAAHRAGHLLWSSSSVEGEVSSDTDEKLAQALRDIYIACDTAIGRLVEAAGNNTTIFIFSLHGMGPNTSRTDVLPAMLAQVLAGGPGAEAGSERISLLKQLRELIPLKWRNNVKSRLPFALQDKLSMFWRMGKINWAETKAVSVTADVHGYIRINLRGREAAGIVEPGDEYDQLCAEIAEGLLTFVDTDTGETVVEDVVRSDQIFPANGRRDFLPDLIVKWSPTPCANHREITSPQYGSIPWPMPGKNPNGRSGNHYPEGFLIANGAHIEPNSHIEGAHILDLPPTIYALFGLSKPNEMDGNALLAFDLGKKEEVLTTQ